MGILNKTAPVQTGKVYTALNNAEIFVTYTGSDTSTAKTVVDNSTKTIQVTALAYTVEVVPQGGVISAEDYVKLAESNATKIAVIGTIGEKVVNVICSASENRLETDLELKYYGPEDASGYAYVVKVTKEPVVGANTHVYTVSQEYIAIMKEDFVTGVTVGNLPAGSQVKAGDKVADLLQTILVGSGPTVDWKFRLYESTEKPTAVTTDWTSADIPTSAKTTGYIFNEVREFGPAKLKRGYLSFAFPAEIGKLKHIYMNGLSFELLDSFTRSEVLVGTVTYYMYVANSERMFFNDNYYKIVWLDTEE